MGKQCQTLFLEDSKITTDGDCSHEIQRRLLLRWKAVTNLDSVLKCRDITLQRKAHIVKAMVFLCMVWKLNNKKGWASKNWCLQTVVLQKTLESPLDCKEIKPVNPKGNQPWIFIGKIDAESEAPILWPPDVKKWFIWKDTNAGSDWRQKDKGMTENEMVGWHHWLNGHEFEQAPGAGEGQGGLACCRPCLCSCVHA